MEFLKFMMVPMVLFMVVVAPLWIVMHYRSISRSTRSLSNEDRQNVEQILVAVDALTERLATLETILNDDHPDWREAASRGARNEE